MLVGLPRVVEGRVGQGGLGALRAQGGLLGLEGELQEPGEGRQGEQPVAWGDPCWQGAVLVRTTLNMKHIMKFFFIFYIFSSISQHVYFTTNISKHILNKTKSYFT